MATKQCYCDHGQKPSHPMDCIEHGAHQCAYDDAWDNGCSSGYSYHFPVDFTNVPTGIQWGRQFDAGEYTGEWRLFNGYCENNYLSIKHCLPNAIYGEAEDETDHNTNAYCGYLSCDDLPLSPEEITDEYCDFNTNRVKCEDWCRFYKTRW